MSDKVEATDQSKRKLLSIFVGASAAAIAVALATPLFGYFLTPVLAKPQRRATIPLARVSEVPVGVPTFFAFEQAVRDAWVTTTSSSGAWVVTQDGKNFVVFDPRCTHLGCHYYWDASKQIFQCPCHAGQFDINGKVVAGPPPRPLDRLPFTVEGGVIELTTTA